jgi:hypothetical protein
MVFPWEAESLPANQRFLLVKTLSFPGLATPKVEDHISQATHSRDHLKVLRHATNAASVIRWMNWVFQPLGGIS